MINSVFLGCFIRLVGLGMHMLVAFVRADMQALARIAWVSLSLPTLHRFDPAILEAEMTDARIDGGDAESSPR